MTSIYRATIEFFTLIVIGVGLIIVGYLWP